VLHLLLHPSFVWMCSAYISRGVYTSPAGAPPAPQRPAGQAQRPNAASPPSNQAAGPLRMAAAHADRTRRTETSPSLGRTVLTTKDKEKALATAKEIGGKVRVEEITPKPKRQAIANMRAVCANQR
jgi:hypothetical protein